MRIRMLAILVVSTNTNIEESWRCGTVGRILTPFVGFAALLFFFHPSPGRVVFQNNFLDFFEKIERAHGVWPRLDMDRFTALIIVITKGTGRPLLSIFLKYAEKKREKKKKKKDRTSGSYFFACPLKPRYYINFGWLARITMFFSYFIPTRCPTVIPSAPLEKIKRAKQKFILRFTVYEIKIKKRKQSWINPK